MIGETILIRPVIADRRPCCCPGAIEVRRQSMMEDVGETAEK